MKKKPVKDSHWMSIRSIKVLLEVFSTWLAKNLIQRSSPISSHFGKVSFETAPINSLPPPAIDQSSSMFPGFSHGFFPTSSPHFHDPIFSSAPLCIAGLRHIRHLRYFRHLRPCPPVPAKLLLPVKKLLTCSEHLSESFESTTKTARRMDHFFT